VWGDILVLPLIGTIDTARAQQIMENLLEAVVKARAAVVIIDITGVPVVDTKVANHLLKTVQATRLLGADAVLTGVSPHNAQTLVRLGVDLTKVSTKSSLQAGLKLAFELTRQKVSKG
jgi:rsbT co-antagonist protein RsbR